MIEADLSGMSATSYALLGQLALRPWSVYDMTKNVRRTLHWFWPRAESVIYAETKRLSELGLARAKVVPGRRGRPRTVYSISPQGRRALAVWLGTAPEGFALHFEALLRVHLAPYGAKQDLLRALEAARGDAEGLLKQALVIGTEFTSGQHQFQHQVHLRAMLFDYLWSFGLGMFLWAERWIERVERWSGLDSTPEAEKQGLALIERCLAEVPPFPVEGNGK